MGDEADMAKGRKGRAAATLAEQISKKASTFEQSDDQRELLDIVDTLRSHGVSHVRTRLL